MKQLSSFCFAFKALWNISHLCTYSLMSSTQKTIFYEISHLLAFSLTRKKKIQKLMAQLEF